MSFNSDMFWSAATAALSALIAIGYCIIAVNWYFQSKLTSHAKQAKTSLDRLRGIWFFCAIAGYTLYVTEMPALLWRCYDALMLVLACRTWWFVFKMRGPGLLDERLAQVNELERSAEHYREIAELLPHMVWTATGDGVVDFSNQRWREYCGDERSWLDALHPDERDAVLDRWRDALIKREQIALETRLGTAGPYRSFLIKATPIVHGSEIRWLGACVDIEDQKLLAAQRELQARQKSFFLNALSHDLRAPLHNVLMNAHLLKMTIKDDPDTESVSMIMENAKAAGDLVSKLLDFARVGAQDHNVMESVPLAATLKQIARRFQPVAEEKGLSLVVLAGNEETHVPSDRQKLERIIGNLVDNAIKYTQRGGVSLEVHGQGGGAGGGAGGAAGGVSVRISDSGIGIPPASAPHLFDEFYQVSNHERDRSKGFGMGLAICKSLAGQIGADVRLVRTGCDGSCFEITLQQQPAVGSDRGGRPGGSPGDLGDPAEAGLCGV